MRLIVAAVLLGLLAACSAAVSGSPAGQPVTVTTTPTTTTTTPTKTITPTTSTTTLAAPPTGIDEHADQQYCDQTITGALGKNMRVVVVATPDGRITCDQAGAVLVDYYAKRPNPDPGSVPIEVDAFACNQVPKPDFPQVICADSASLFYSMWPQT
jgi:hypothetical protein